MSSARRREFGSAAVAEGAPCLSHGVLGHGELDCHSPLAVRHTGTLAASRFTRRSRSMAMRRATAGQRAVDRPDLGSDAEDAGAHNVANHAEPKRALP